MPINYDNDWPKLMKAYHERGREIERLRAALRWLKSKAYISHTDHFARDKKDTYQWTITFHSSCTTIENALKQALKGDESEPDNS